MARTYQDFAAENLQGFGWQVDASQVPEYDTCMSALRVLSEWWNNLDERTRGIVGGCDLADGLWNAGMFSSWEGLYYLVQGNRFDLFGSTMNDIQMSLERAHQQAEDEPPGLPGGTGIDDVTNPGNADDAETNR